MLSIGVILTTKRATNVIFSFSPNLAARDGRSTILSVVDGTSPLVKADIIEKAIGVHNRGIENLPGGETVKWLKNFVDAKGSRLSGNELEAEYHRVRNSMLTPARVGLSSLYRANKWLEFYRDQPWDFVKALRSISKTDDTSKYKFVLLLL